MAPKTKFTREQIIEAAFEIARTEGLDSITIRKLAKSLGSSIAPIYVNFKDLDELIEAVITKTYDIGNQLYRDLSTGNPFHDMAIASLRFAKDYSILFRELMLKDNSHMKGYDQEMGNMLVEEMKQDPELAGFNDEELRSILLKMRIFQLGLSVMVANNLLPNELDDEKVLNILESAGFDVIVGTRFIKNQTK